MRCGGCVAFLLIYLLLDPSGPMTPGAVSDPEDRVAGAQLSQPHVESPGRSVHPQPGFAPIMHPYETLRLKALLARESATARPLLSIRRARAASSEPPDSAEDH